MELREYLKIFKDNFKLFAIIVAVVILGTFVYFTLKPISFSASLALNITRNGFQQTADYRYDDFYRLQADEKFAETVVEWLKNARTAADILDAAGMNSNTLSLRQLSKTFVAEKLSSQVVSVSFSAKDEISAKNISAAVLEVINKNTDSLNKNQNENTWFAVVAQNPVIVQDRISSIILFLASLAMGMFLGFWIVMLKHYLR